MATRTLTMSHTELDRFGVITRVRERRLTQVEAARMLNLGVRQVQRLCAARAVKASHSLGPTSRTPSSGPEGPASAHVAPVCHMHYDVACPQWNGSIAVASRCTSKTTRLRTFTSSRQVTNVYLWLSNRSKYWRHGRFTRCDRGAHLGQD
jgi:hypothetical protein